MKTVSVRILAAVLLSLGISSHFERASAQGRESRIPMRSLAVHVARPAASTFLERLEQFAGKNGFRFGKSVVHPDGRHFSVAIERADIRIAAVNSFDVERFNIYVYANEALPDIRGRVEASIAALKSELTGIQGITFLNREAPEQYVKTLALEGLGGHEGIKKMRALGFECDVKSEIPPGSNPKGEMTGTGEKVVFVPRYRIECKKQNPDIGKDCPQLAVLLFIDHSRIDRERQKNAPLDDSRIWRTHGECRIARA
jgi:hypothetical protein